MAVDDETQTSGEQLPADGVGNTLSFGPALVEVGTVVDGIDQVEIDTCSATARSRATDPARPSA